MSLFDGIGEFYNILKDKALTFISMFRIGKMIFSCYAHDYEGQNKLTAWNWHGYKLDFSNRKVRFSPGNTIERANS